MKKPGESDAVSEVKHRHGDFVTCLQYKRVNKSIIYVTIHKQKSTHQHEVPQQSTQTATNYGLKTLEKNHWTFFMALNGANF